MTFSIFAKYKTVTSSLTRPQSSLWKTKRAGKETTSRSGVETLGDYSSVAKVFLIFFQNSDEADNDLYTSIRSLQIDRKSLGNAKLPLILQSFDTGDPSGPPLRMICSVR